MQVCVISRGYVIDVIIPKFNQLFFQESLSNTLSYALNVCCASLNLDVTVSMIDNEVCYDVSANPLHIDLTASKTGDAPVEETLESLQATTSMYCINLLPRKGRSMKKRRHCLSRSVKHSLKQLQQEASGAIKINEMSDDRFTEEEKKYDWNGFITVILQFLDGVSDIGENGRFVVYDSFIEGVSLSYFSRILSYFYGVYQYMNKTKNETKAAMIMNYLETLLEQRCSRWFIVEDDI